MHFGDEKNGTARAILHPSVQDIAWAAGFLEGEGCFGRTGGKCRGSGERINVGQRSMEPLERLLALFGGSIRWQHQVTRNLIKQDGLSPHMPYWGVYGSRARGVMMTVYPFMSNRRKEAIRKALTAPN